LFDHTYEITNTQCTIVLLNLNVLNSKEEENTDDQSQIEIKTNLFNQLAKNQNWYQFEKVQADIFS